MLVRIFTTLYKASHFAEPKGRGLWAFVVYANAKEQETIFAPSGMTLTEAKKWAREYCVAKYSNRTDHAELQVAP